jgi:2-methylaconitate cis-trans-isomerase PrpF
MDNLEKIRGTACVMMGLAKDLKEATDNQPGVPKVGFVTVPKNFVDIEGKDVDAEKMDVCARVISVFKCHKAIPLTAASSVSTAAFLEGTIVNQIAPVKDGQTTVRIGHPSGIMTMVPTVIKEGNDPAGYKIPGVAVQRTARRIMDGSIYISR